MKIIDLSQIIYSGMEVYSGDPEVKIEKVRTIEEDSWELRYIQMGSHTGTHVDAFSHMHHGSAAIDEIPIYRFMGMARLVSREEDWEEGVGLIFKEVMDIYDLGRILDHKPGFVGGELDEELERRLLEHGIITYTGLVNLELLPQKTSFMFYGVPLKIKSGDGSPVRAYAVLD